MPTEPDDSDDPRQLYDESRQLRAQADELEERAVRAALRRSRWLMRRVLHLTFGDGKQLLLMDYVDLVKRT
jgi:hypothetical protein